MPYLISHEVVVGIKGHNRMQFSNLYWIEKMWKIKAKKLIEMIAYFQRYNI
jgi:hypothetical protein